MSEPKDLGARIEAELVAARGRVEEMQKEAGRRYEATRRRHERFEELAEKVLLAGRQPLATLASYFDNATVRRSQDREGFHIRCRFRHTPRFPASVELRFDLTYDEEVRNFVAAYQLQILPVFVDFEHADRIVRDLDELDVDEIAAWIDDKIVAFVQTYLQISIADEYQKENLVTDPVARVRFSKTMAAGTVEYRGHAYHFVSQATLDAFEEEPEKWVSG